MQEFLIHLEEVTVPTFDYEVLSRHASEALILDANFQIISIADQLCDFLNRIQMEGGHSLEDTIFKANLMRLNLLLHNLYGSRSFDNSQIHIVLNRMIFETVVNMKFLKSSNFEYTEDYVEEAFHNRIELLRTVERRIEVRGGDILPIEDRIIKSIDWFCKVSGIDTGKLKSKKKNKWIGTNLKARASHTNLDELYLAFYGMTSDVVHGNWFDLVTQGVERIGGRFTIEFEKPKVRPQPINAVARLAIDTIEYFVAESGYFQIKDAIDKRCNHCRKCLHELHKCHEVYLAGRNWPET